MILGSDLLNKKKLKFNIAACKQYKPTADNLLVLLTYLIVQVQYVIEVHLITYTNIFDNTDTRGVLVIEDPIFPHNVRLCVHLFSFEQKNRNLFLQRYLTIKFGDGKYYSVVSSLIFKQYVLNCFAVCFIDATYRVHVSIPLFW